MVAQRSIGGTRAGRITLVLTASVLAGALGCGGSGHGVSRDASLDLPASEGPDDARSDQAPEGPIADGSGRDGGPDGSQPDGPVGPQIVSGFNALPALTSPRFAHTATLLADGRVLIVGGQDEIFDDTNDKDILYEWTQHTLATAEVHDVRAATVMTTGSLASPRHDHTATVLSDGRVLIVGGTNETGRLASAEIYDPATGLFTMTGSLATARDQHTATLLPDGKVLVIGGHGATADTIATTEVYDPSTGQFTAAGSLASPRYRHSATLLPSGKVLIAGGYRFGIPGAMASAELYAPSSGAFSATGSMASARSQHTATLLSDGKVLVVGGTGDFDGTLGYVDYASAELYDPATGAFTPTGTLGVKRLTHTATLLLDGDVLIAGGYNHLGTRTDQLSAELYHPASGTFSTVGPLPEIRSSHTATRLADGRVFIAGAYGFVTATAVYDPTTHTFSSRATDREGHTATALPDGTVLFAGGTNNGGYLATSAIYDPASFALAPSGTLAGPRAGQTATLLAEGRVFLIGGFNLKNQPMVPGEIYDPVTRSFSLAGMPGTDRISHTATRLANGKVLVVGGWYGGTLASTELADPANKTFAPSGSLATARQLHTATLLADGRVLIAGGQGASGSLASAEIYDPATGTFKATGSMATGRFSHSATALPDGRVLMIGGWSGTVTTSSSFPTSYQGQAVGGAELYDPASGTFSPAGALNQASYAHAAALRPDGTVLILGGSNSASPVVWAAFHRAALDRAEIYDLATKTFSTAGKMKIPRDAPTATTLATGDVLIAGGNAAGSNGNYTLGLVEIYR
jgi:hypothetical protein